MLDYQMLDHISLNVRDIARSVDFYKRVLKLTELERPDFDYAGAWFAIGNTGQQLHLIQYNGETLRNGGLDTKDGHFALRISDYENTINWLNQCGIAYEARPVNKAGFPQIYLLDPDQNVIELNLRKN